VQAFVALSPYYFIESINAHNHMLDSLSFVAGLYLFITILRRPNPLLSIVAGILCGLAGLTRYTSYALFALPITLYFLMSDYHKATKLAVAFWSGIAISSVPWWYSNWIINGSPIYNLDYLNICTAVVPAFDTDHLVLYKRVCSDITVYLKLFLIIRLAL